MKIVVALASLLVATSAFRTERVVEPSSVATPEARVVATPEPRACPAVGTWQVEGTDSIHWSAELVLLEESNDGYFDWLSENGDSGRELLKYEYDPLTSTLRLHGFEIVEPHGNITYATYQATVVSNGRLIVDGTWWGPPAMSGFWEATR